MNCMQIEEIYSSFDSDLSEQDIYINDYKHWSESKKKRIKNYQK